MSAPTVPAWAYQAPRRPQSHPNQCYYRSEGFHHIADPAGDPRPDERITLFRFAPDVRAVLTLAVPQGSLSVECSAVQLQLLRDALNDVLHDIAQVQADAERRESFERIQDDLREAGEGGPGVYYSHPDVHYVPADQVQAKVSELEAAGAPRYIVLADPAREGAAA